MKYVSKSLAETAEIARNFLETLETLSGATVVALSGELGSGKTTFAQALGMALGITESIQSPTFVIEKIYDINFKNFRRLIHIDAYRLEKEAELLHLGWEEITSEPENLILIEWPENASGVIPKSARTIRFEHRDENTREISYD